jgi:hypothetical protein
MHKQGFFGMQKWHLATPVGTGYWKTKKGFMKMVFLDIAS